MNRAAQAPAAPLFTEEEARAIDAAMLADKAAVPGRPLVDGYEKRRQEQALRLQSRHNHQGF